MPDPAGLLAHLTRRKADFASYGLTGSRLACRSPDGLSCTITIKPSAGVLANSTGSMDTGVSATLLRATGTTIAFEMAGVKALNFAEPGRCSLVPASTLVVCSV